MSIDCPRYNVAVPYEIQRAESPRLSEAYLLTCDRRRFYIGALAAGVLDGLRERRSLAEIAEDLRSRSGTITFERVRGVVESQLVPLGLVVADGAEPAVTAARPQKYVRISTTLIPPAVVRRIVAPLRPLSGPIVSAALFTLALLMYVPYVGRFGAKVLLPWTYVSTIGHFHLTEFVLLYALLVGSIFFHELGHATAAARHGVRVGEIGFGLYLLFPVFFTDVSEAWKVGKYKRVAINLGGVYFQSLANAVLIACALFTGNEVLRYAILINAFGIVYAMNPFLRFDGYWILSDLAGIRGLRAQSLQFGRELRRGAWRERVRLLRANPFMATYGLLCALFFALLALVYVRLLVRVVTVPTSVAGGVTHWLLLAYIVIKAVMPAVRKRMNGMVTS